MAFQPLPPLGQDDMAGSLPVAIASDQSAVPVSGTVTANIGTVGTLATAAKQDTGNTSLGTIAGAVSGTEMQVDVLTMPTTTVQATNLDIRDIDKGSDDILVYGNTAKDGSGTSYVPLLDTDGHSQVDVLSSALPSGASTSAKQDTVIGHLDGVETLLGTIDADTGNISTKIDTVAGAVSGTEMQVDVITMPTVQVQSNSANLATQTTAAAIQTSVELIDDTVKTLGTDTYTEATSKGVVLGAVRRDADTTLANTTNEFAPLQVDANGYLKVEVFDGGGSHTVDNAGTFAVQVDGSALTALQLIDDPVQVLGTDTYSEATSKGVTIGAVRRDADTTLVNTTNEFGPLQMDANGRLKVEAFSGETLPVSLASVPSHAVTNAGTFAVQVDGNALTALQLIDDVVYTDDTSTHSTGSSKGALFMAAATPTDGSVNANDIGAVAMTTDRKLHVSVQDALPAGTNAIGKLAANSGVDIGDVDVTSIAAGSNTIGGTYCIPNTSGGLATFNATSSDGATALTNSAQAIKASAGQLFGWYIYNPNAAAAAFVQLYNTASASVTVGTTNPLFMITVPAGSAANVFSDIGITFSNAGWSAAATSTAGGNGALGSAIDAVFFYK